MTRAAEGRRTATVRIGNWNLGNGGVDGPNETRRKGQAGILGDLELDVLALEELTGWEAEDWSRLCGLAHLDMTPLPPVTSHIGDQRNHVALLRRRPT